MTQAMGGIFMTPEFVEELLGVKSGGLGSVGWLVIQEEAQGVSRSMIAKNLKCEESDIIMLIESITGLEGDSALDQWKQGVTAVLTANRMNAMNVGSGWDAVEAMAVDRLGRALSSMKTFGDPDQMLRIAAQANKAIRRRDGEGQGGGRTTVQVNAGGDGMNLELQSGHLGTLRLNLSPRVQAQLSNPNRVIEAKVVGSQDTTPKKQNLEMLGIAETRKLAPIVESTSKTGQTLTYDFSQLLEEST